MKRTFLVAGAAIAALAMAGNANAETYVGVGLSQELTSVEGFNLDDGTGLDVTLGLDAANLPLRFEGRVARINNDTDVFGLEVGVNAIQYSADAYLDVDMGWDVTPYVGGGVSYTDGEVDVLFSYFLGLNREHALEAGAFNIRAIYEKRRMLKSFK
jgi:opacity protein-like surface antigen